MTRGWRHGGPGAGADPPRGPLLLRDRSRNAVDTQQQGAPCSAMSTPFLDAHQVCLRQEGGSQPLPRRPRGSSRRQQSSKNAAAPIQDLSSRLRYSVTNDHIELAGRAVAPRSCRAKRSDSRASSSG